MISEPFFKNPLIPVVRCSWLLGIFLLVGGLISLPARLDASGVSDAPENIAVLRSIVAELADSLVAEHSAGDTLLIEIPPSDGSWMIEQGLADVALSRGITVVAYNSASPQIGIRLQAAIVSAGVAYDPIGNSDSLRRTVRVELAGLYQPLSAETSGVTGGLIRSWRLDQLRVDTVAYDETARLEAGGYSFASGRLPERSRSSFWNKVAEPAIIIGAATVMVILLFTVRSQ